jgi:hypothetical protein
LDIQQFILSYPWTYPLISLGLSYAISTLISKTLSMYIKVLILLISSTYSGISFHLSCWIFDPDSAGPACPRVQRLDRFRQATVFIYPHTSGANQGAGPCSLATEHLFTTVMHSSAAAGWGLCSPVGRSGCCRRHPLLWCPATRGLRGRSAVVSRPMTTSITYGSLWGCKAGGGRHATEE